MVAETVSPFITNDLAAGRFREGLDCVKRPPFHDATQHFAVGLADLGVSAELLEGIATGTADIEQLPVAANTLQASDGFRDLGFTGLRRWLYAKRLRETVPDLARAARNLQVATGIPETILEEVAAGERNLEPDELAQVVARRGVARALVLRARSSEAAELREMPAVFTSALFPWVAERKNDELFHEVDEELTLGNDGYWRISNAMVAMRDLRANENVSLLDARMKEWYKKTGQALRWTYDKDRRKLPAGIATVVRHACSMLTRPTARNAMRSPKRV